MTEINDLMNELKVKICRLLDDAKDEGFKAGKEVGVLKSIEALRNLDSTKVEEKLKVKRKYKKKIKVQEKPESVIKKEVITESVTKKNIGQPFREEAFNKVIESVKQEEKISLAIKKSGVSRNSFYNYIMVAIERGLISQEEYDSKKDNRGGARYKNKHGKFKEFILNLKPGEYRTSDFINEGFSMNTVKNNLTKAIENPEFKIKKISRGHYVKEGPAQIKELDSKEEAYPEQLYKPKTLIVSEPKKEYEEPDPAEVEMNLKIIEEEGAKKPSREWIPCKVCGNKTPEWGDNGGVCKKCRGKEVLKPKKEEVKPKPGWIPCIICGGKIKEAKRDGNVCKICRGEANEFSVSNVSKTRYNIRCKECGIGRPKREFRGGHGACRACRGLK